jgi:hypothetical protein
MLPHMWKQHLVCSANNDYFVIAINSSGGLGVFFWDHFVSWCVHNFNVIVFGSRSRSCRCINVNHGYSFHLDLGFLGGTATSCPACLRFDGFAQLLPNIPESLLLCIICQVNACHGIWRWTLGHLLG